jgi:two-component system phosphate regulon sensor histidine kinase PhoR
MHNSRASLLRWLVLPQVLIAVAGLGILAGVLAAAHARWDLSFGTLLLITSVGWIMALVLAATVSYRNAIEQRREIAEEFRHALPPPLAELVRLDAPDVLDHLASAFGELIAQSREDQAQLRTIISSMTDALLATDHRQHVLLSNGAATELLGVPADARGKPLWEVLPVEGILSAVAEVSLTGQRKTVTLAFGDGMQIEVTTCRLPLRPAGFVIIARDITEAARYEQLRKDFIANVSHELRTPLTLISGFVETLRDGVDDRERAAKYLSTVHKHSKQLGNLIDDLLSLSRLEADSSPRDRSPLYLHELAEKVRELLLPAAQNKGQQLSVELRGQPPPVMADAPDLERALTNLVDNAVKYTPAGGAIRIVVSVEDGQPLVQVIDSGVGIPTADLPRIFERFYRVDRSRSREMGGTGLGLSIVKHVVQRHGGSIEAVSTVGAGSCFTVRLPAAPRAAVVDRMPTPP